MGQQSYPSADAAWKAAWKEGRRIVELYQSELVQVSLSRAYMMDKSPVVYSTSQMVPSWACMCILQGAWKGEQRADGGARAPALTAAKTGAKPCSSPYLHGPTVSHLSEKHIPATME